MFERFVRLFRRVPGPERPSFLHPVLGRLEFLAGEQEWQSAGESPVYHGGLRGGAEGPDPEAVAEILRRLDNVDAYWDACTEDLLYIASCHSSFPVVTDPRDLYRVAALSLYEGYWEICFETHARHRWLHVGMQFEGERLVSNTIDT